MDFIEEQRKRYDKFQKRIDRLSTEYCFVSCDNKAMESRVRIKEIKKNIYNLCRTTEEELSYYKGSCKPCKSKDLRIVYHQVSRKRKDKM